MLNSIALVLMAFRAFACREPTTMYFNQVYVLYIVDVGLRAIKLIYSRHSCCTSKIFRYIELSNTSCTPASGEKRSLTVVVMF